MRLFKGDNGDAARIPCITAAPDGTVYAFANIRVGTAIDHADETKIICSVKKPGSEFSVPRILAGQTGWSFMIGTAVCDENTGKVMLFFKKTAVVLPEFGEKMSEEERRMLAAEKEKADGLYEGDYLLESSDGENFRERRIEITPSTSSRIGFLTGSGGFSHGGAAGITMKYGKYAGRLVVPARFSIHPVNTWEDLKTGSTNTVIYSDDHGEHWHTGGIVEPGTGEGTVAERSDGSLYYNSRAYFGEGLRHGAVSYDGGISFTEQTVHQDLIEPCCNAAMIRVERKSGPVFFFSNPHSRTERVDMSIHYSRDEGKTWQLLCTVDHRKASYSGLAYDSTKEKLYLICECGEESCIDEIDVTEIEIKGI